MELHATGAIWQSFPRLILARRRYVGVGGPMRMGGADGYGEVFVFTARRSPFSGATTIAVTPRLADNESLVAVFPRAMFGSKEQGQDSYPRELVDILERMATRPFFSFRSLGRALCS